MNEPRLPILVREATPRDIPALAELLRREASHAQEIAKFFQLDPHFDWTARTQGMLAAAHRRMFVAEQRGELVGFLDVQLCGSNSITPGSFRSRLRRKFMGGGLRTGPTISRAPWAVIEGCFVVAQARRQGLGSALLQHGLAWIKDQGIDRVEIGVMAGNRDAVGFWSTQGFTPFRLHMAREWGSLDKHS